MNIEQALKDYIIEHFGTAKAFATAIDMPNSTLDNIFRRGVLNSSIANIIKICDALNISADGLANGQIIHRKFSFEDTYAPTPKETELIKKYFELDERGKAAVVATIEREYAESTRLDAAVADAASTAREVAAAVEMEKRPAGAKK